MTAMDVDQDGDRDPISAGSVGEAVGGGGSMAVVGMSANPIGAHQVDRHMAGCGDRRQAVIPVICGLCL